MDGLVHPAVRSAPLEAGRHATFLATHLAAGCLALILFPAYLALHGQFSLAGAAVFALLAAPIPIALFLARTGRLEDANILSSLVFCTLVGIVCLRTGGLESWGLVWLPLACGVAGLSGSRRVVGWAGFFALATAVLVGLVDLRLVVAPAPADLARMVLTIAAIASAGSVAFLVQRQQRADAEMTRLGETRYALLAENTNDLITRHGASGRVTYASPGAMALVGTGPETLLGQGLFERVHVADRPVYLAALSAAHAGACRSAEFRLRRGADSLNFAWTEMRCQPFRDSGDVVAVMRDISERKAQEAALEAARIEAEKSNAAKSRLLAMMSHELRTPLNAVIGFSEMLMSEDSLGLEPARRREYAGLIRDSGLHLLSVVNGILDMSKIETGNFATTPEPFMVDELVESCCAMMLLKAESGHIRLEKAVGEDAGDLVADKRACRQIYLNLISNALKFTPAGGTVVVGARREASGMAFFVSDTGIGIGRDDLARLGEAFFQASASYDRVFEGTGLGLCVVKGLAEIHGGRMEIDSTLGAGTTVTIRLPLDCESEASRSALANANIERLPSRPLAAGAAADPTLSDEPRKRRA